MENRINYLATLKQRKLRDVCKVLGLSASGTKRAMAARIAKRERNGWKR